MESIAPPSTTSRTLDADRDYGKTTHTDSQIIDRKMLAAGQGGWVDDSRTDRSAYHDCCTQSLAAAGAGSRVLVVPDVVGLHPAWDAGLERPLGPEVSLRVATEQAIRLARDRHRPGPERSCTGLTERRTYERSTLTSEPCLPANHAYQRTMLTSAARSTGRHSPQRAPSYRRGGDDAEGEPRGLSSRGGRGLS
jgi:hypothetical protein